MAMKNKKPSQGRQKIAIAKIAKRSNLQVTFSKRRSGLFKKASELCTLCGVEIAIIIFSPANKPFSFGHPNVDSLLDCFHSTQNHFLESNVGTQQLVSDHAHNYTNASSVHELNLMLTETENQLEMEKRRGQSLDKVSDSGHRSSGSYWWENPIDELGLKELRMLKAAMEDLKKNVTDEMSKILMLQSCATINSTSPFFTMNGIQIDGYPLESKPTDGSAINLGYGHGFF